MKPKHGDYKEADNIRYNRHCEETKEPLERKEWDVKRENLKKSQERGREEEIKGRKALGEHLNRTLEDNNSGKVVTYTSSEGHLTRPDSIGRNAKDEIDLVHDHKHKISDKNTLFIMTVKCELKERCSKIKWKSYCDNIKR